MDPNQYPQNQPGQNQQQPQNQPPQNPYAPQVSGPAQNVPYGGQTINGNVISPPRKPNPLIIIGVGLIVLLITATIIVLLATGGSSDAPATTTKKPTTNTSQVPIAATGDSVQQTNDAISQSISSLNDTAEFPADALSDQKLNIN